MEAELDVNPQIVERPVTSDLIPTDQLQQALPGLCSDFFKSPLDGLHRKRFIHVTSFDSIFLLSFIWQITLVDSLDIQIHNYLKFSDVWQLPLFQRINSCMRAFAQMPRLSL